MTSVLVVDDDVYLRRVLQRDLTESGYEVRTASSVAEARALIAEATPDIVLTDLRMSDEDGIDLLSSIRDLDLGIRSILMAAYAAPRDREAAIELGAVRVLHKPFTLVELLQALRQADGRGSVVHPNATGLSLLDFLQAFHHSRQSITVRVSSPMRGEIHFRDGEVVHALLDQESGEDALRSMLAATGAAVTTAPPEEAPVTVHRSFRSLILDLLRQLDERGPGKRSAKQRYTTGTRRRAPGAPRTSRRVGRTGS